MNLLISSLFVFLVVVRPAAHYIYCRRLRKTQQAALDRENFRLRVEELRERYLGSVRAMICDNLHFRTSKGQIECIDYAFVDAVEQSILDLALSDEPIETRALATMKRRELHLMILSGIQGGRNSVITGLNEAVAMALKRGDFAQTKLMRV